MADYRSRTQSSAPGGGLEKASPGEPGRPDPAKKALDRADAAAKRQKRHVCPACLRPSETCICASVRPFSPGVHFVFLMHPKEARGQKTGTGRPAHLCLEGSEILAGIDFSDHPRVNELLADPGLEPVVLFPDPAPLSPTDLAERLRGGRRRLLVFAIDGTWIAARKMMKLSANLAQLPRVSLVPAQPSRFALKHQPHPWCLSTIEAVHLLLEELAARGAPITSDRHGALPAILDALVESQARFVRERRSLSGRRRAPGGPQEARAPSPKNRRRIPFGSDSSGRDGSGR